MTPGYLESPLTGERSTKRLESFCSFQREVLVLQIRKIGHLSGAHWRHVFHRPVKYKYPKGSILISKVQALTFQ